MKRYLIIIILFINNITIAQTIFTTGISLIDKPTIYAYEDNMFIVKKDFIVWTAKNASYIYNIVSYNKLSDNIYIIYCNTDGKLCTFIIDFSNNYVIVNNNLVFSKVTKL